MGNILHDGLDVFLLLAAFYPRTGFGLKPLQ